MGPSYMGPRISQKSKNFAKIRISQKSNIFTKIIGFRFRYRGRLLRASEASPVACERSEPCCDVGVDVEVAVDGPIYLCVLEVQVGLGVCAVVVEAS